jgi:UDPglucose 6-dehydrogenase
MKDKKIAVIGTGYVGLVTGTCLADLGVKVTCVDVDKEKIEKLKKGIIPIFEDDLEEIVKKNVKAKTLCFTTDTKKAVEENEVIFIAVGTPSLPDGSVNLDYVKTVADEIGQAINGYKVIVNKSTVPIGTGDLVSRIIKKYYSGSFDVASNPEFLREGTAVWDFMNPDRIVLGLDSKKAGEKMLDLYKDFDCPKLVTDIKTAEMIKYASNAYLATSISFINSIANICEQIGADVTEVAEGMRLDKRIGRYSFLNAGVGYGGSCFPKDVKGLIQIAHENNVRFSILEAVESTNEAQKQSVVSKIQRLLGEDLNKKKIALLGLAFKAHTDDMRDAPSLTIIKQLQDRGAEVSAYDPVAEKQAKEVTTDVKFYGDIYKMVKDKDVIVIPTEWPEFKELDWVKIKSLMKKANVIDGRNVLDKNEMLKLGFDYISVGR